MPASLATQPLYFEIAAQFPLSNCQMQLLPLPHFTYIDVNLFNTSRHFVHEYTIERLATIERQENDTAIYRDDTTKVQRKTKKSTTVLGHGTTIISKTMQTRYHSTEFSKQKLILTVVIIFWQLKDALLSYGF